MQKPEIPKRLAARVRAAQYKVMEARDGIVYDWDSGAQDAERIEEYESDPDAFARKYYGNKSSDSYPVQTNISRCREALERRLDRQADRIEALVSAEDNLRQVERQVYQEVNQMRPGTRGRVPWPEPLISMEELRDKQLLINQQLEVEHDRQQAMIEKELEAEEAEDRRISRMEEDAADREWQAEFALMSVEERKAHKKSLKKLYDALSAGKITAVQITNYLNSRGR